jgi:hypothetical protein
MAVMFSTLRTDRALLPTNILLLLVLIFVGGWVIPGGLVRLEQLGKLIKIINISDSIHPDEGGDMFLRNIGCYNSHTSSHIRR